jgi:WD40 repeat protein
MHTLPHTAFAVVACLTVAWDATGPPAGSSASERPPAKGEPVPTDLYGDPLPAGAIARLGTIRNRLGGPLAPVALSRDLRLLATLTSTEIALLDTATGKQIRAIPQQLLPIPAGVRRSAALALAPDGELLAIRGPDGISFWDVASGRRRGGADGSEREFSVLASLAFSPDGKLLAAGTPGFGPAGSAGVWEVPGGQQVALLHNAAPGMVQVAFTPDGKGLACWGATGALPNSAPATGPPPAVLLWDLATAKQVRRLAAEQGAHEVRAVAHSPDGKLLAMTTDWPTVILWDLATGKATRRMGRRRGQDVILQFSLNSQVLAAALDDGAVQLWEVATGKRLAQGAGPRGQPLGLVFSPGGQVQACVAEGQRVCLWEVASGKVLTPRGGPSHAVAGVAFLDGGRLLSAGLDRQLFLWETGRGKELGRVRLEGSELKRLLHPALLPLPLAFPPTASTRPPRMSKIPTTSGSGIARRGRWCLT